MLEAGLTEQSYRDSLTRGIECIRAQGVATTDLVPVDDRGTLSYIFSGEGVVADAEVPKIADACAAQFHSSIDAQWASSLDAATGVHDGAARVSGEATEPVATFPSEFKLEN